MFKYERYLIYSLLGILLFVVIIFHSIGTSIDDSKKAADEAIRELVAEQRASMNYFEAMEAYSESQRMAAFAIARDVQAKCGIPFESSKQILEYQKRAFGEILPESTKQFAAFWAMHAGPSTIDLIRWMGTSGIKDPERQGQIMRMIKAATKYTGLTNQEMIEALASYGTHFRYLGWSPEQTIENLSKVMVPGEGMKGVESMLIGLENFTEEKAYETGMPRPKK